MTTSRSVSCSPPVKQDLLHKGEEGASRRIPTDCCVLRSMGSHFQSSIHRRSQTAVDLCSSNVPWNLGSMHCKHCAPQSSANAGPSSDSTIFYWQPTFPFEPPWHHSQSFGSRRNLDRSAPRSRKVWFRAVVSLVEVLVRFGGGWRPPSRVSKLDFSMDD